MTPETHASVPRQQILEEALRSSTHGGRGGVTMRALASKLGYSPAHDLPVLPQQGGSAPADRAPRGCELLHGRRRDRATEMHRRRSGARFSRAVAGTSTFAIENPHSTSIMARRSTSLPFLADREPRAPGRAHVRPLSRPLRSRARRVRAASAAIEPGARDADRTGRPCTASRCSRSRAAGSRRRGMPGRASRADPRRVPRRDPDRTAPSAADARAPTATFSLSYIDSLRARSDGGARSAGGSRLLSSPRRWDEKRAGP